MRQRSSIFSQHPFTSSGTSKTFRLGSDLLCWKIDTKPRRRPKGLLNQHSSIRPRSQVTLRTGRLTTCPRTALGAERQPFLKMHIQTRRPPQHTRTAPPPPASLADEFNKSKWNFGLTNEG